MIPVVLCGGAGRRLWPLSRPDRPKPLLEIGGEALLLATARRFEGEGFLAPWLVAGSDHASAMSEAVPGAAKVVSEPFARGTAAAVAAAALLARQEGVEVPLLVTPADQVVHTPEVLREAARAACGAARAGHIVTFGLAPGRAATEYGWIRPGQAVAGTNVRCIDRFVEKPDRALAERLFLEGEHLWNAGMFLFLAETVLEEMARYAPQVLEVAQAAVQRATREGKVHRLDADALRAAPTASFDVAVMERTERAAVAQVSCGWSDVGTWSAVAALQPLPAVTGPVELQQSPGTFAYSDGPQVAVLGAPDLVVVATGGAVLVAGRGQVERCSELLPPVEALLDRGQGYEVRRRWVAAGEELSVQAGGQAIVLSGHFEGGGPGAVLGHGSHRTERGSTVVIVTIGACPLHSL